MMKRLLALALVLWVSACTSCSKDDSRPENAASSPAKSSPPPSIVNPRTEPIPTEEDFEEEAIREIQPDKLEAELDRLESESAK